VTRGLRLSARAPWRTPAGTDEPAPGGRRRPPRTRWWPPPGRGPPSCVAVGAGRGWRLEWLDTTVVRRSCCWGRSRVQVAARRRRDLQGTAVPRDHVPGSVDGGELIGVGLPGLVACGDGVVDGGVRLRGSDFHARPGALPPGAQSPPRGVADFRRASRLRLRPGEAVVGPEGGDTGGCRG
jgi:hypothetical protein